MIYVDGVHFDYIDSGLASGSTIEMVNSASFETTQRTLLSFRALLQIDAHVKASMSEADSLALNVNTEAELKTELATAEKSQIEQLRKVTTTIPADAVYGTVIPSISWQFGGLEIPVALTPITNIWNASRVKQFVGEPMTRGMAMMVGGLLGEAVERPEIPHKVWEPLKGVTCHHQKFCEITHDDCRVDGKNAVSLDGTQIVVCHHRNWNFIGGLDCDCGMVDDHFVRVVSAKKLSGLYKH